MKSRKFGLTTLFLPVLRSTFGDDVVQHRPQSFTAARCKARVQSPPVGVLRQPERYGPYKDPLFLVVGHDLKLKTKSATLGRLQTKFVALLETCFRFTPEYFPENDCWVDVGLEDTPEQKQL